MLLYDHVEKIKKDAQDDGGQYQQREYVACVCSTHVLGHVVEKRLQDAMVHIRKSLMRSQRVKPRCASWARGQDLE